MLVAALKSSGQSVVFEEGRGLLIAGEPFDLLRLVEADRAGDVDWAGPDIRDWAYDALKPAPAAAPVPQVKRPSFLNRAIPRAVPLGILYSVSLLMTIGVVVNTLRGIIPLDFGRTIAIVLLWAATWFAARRKVVTRDESGVAVGLFGLRRTTTVVLTVLALFLAFGLLAVSPPVESSAATASPVDGTWVSGTNPQNGGPVFRLAIEAGRYELGDPDGTRFEAGSVSVNETQVTLSPTWEMSAEEDFWGAGHGRPFTTGFSVSGDQMTLSGDPALVVVKWTRE